MCELHKSFNETANIQGEQGSIPRTRREPDWTHSQSSEPSDEPLLNDKYSDDNAKIRLQHLDYSDETHDKNTLQTFEGLITKPLFESPKVLVTQATQSNTGNLNVEGCTDGCNKPLLDKADEQQMGAAEKVEVSFSVVLSGSAEIEVQKIADAKVIQNLNNRVSSQETLSDSVKDITAGRDKTLPRTFVKCLQSQSAVEVKVSLLDSFDVMIDNDSNKELGAPIIGMRTKKCFSDASWLQRNAINKPLNRVRLISSSNSLTRLRSHHSSSDEDWFEEVQETESLISKGKVNAPTGFLLKKQSKSLVEMSFQSVPREGRDTSPASNIEFVQKQSEALVNESHSSGPDGQLKPVEEQIVENGSRSFKCCVIL